MFTTMRRLSCVAGLSLIISLLSPDSGAIEPTLGISGQTFIGTVTAMNNNITVTSTPSTTNLYTVPSGSNLAVTDILLDSNGGAINAVLLASGTVRTIDLEIVDARVINLRTPVTFAPGQIVQVQMTKTAGTPSSLTAKIMLLGYRYSTP